MTTDDAATPALGRGDVVYVVPSFPTVTGGPDHVAEQLATRVSARRQVYVITSDSQAGPAPTAYPPSLTVRRLRTFRVFGVPVMPRLARELLATPRTSIIHVHVSQPFAPELVWLVATLMRRRYVAHFLFDVEPSTRLGPLFVLWKRYVLAKVMRAAFRVVVPSHEQAVTVEDLYGVPAKKISVIPKPVSAELLTLASRPDLGMRTLRILYTGVLAGSDAGPGVLDVVSCVHSPVEMAIVSDRADLAGIEARVRLTDLEAVRVVGTESPDAGTQAGDSRATEDEEWFAWADVLVVVGEPPGTDRVLGRALAAGLPVVAADGPLVRSVAGSAALLADRSAESFSAAIDRVASEHDLRAELGQAARRRATALAWDRVAAAMDDVYRAVAG